VRLLGEVTPEQYVAMSLGERKLAGALQGDRVLRERLELLVGTIEPRCRLHGDLRPENVLLRGGQQRHPVLIDWELSRLSDPAVELGYFVGCVLDRCLGSVRARSLEGWRVRARARLVGVGRALSVWWRHYCDSAARTVAARPVLPLLVLSHAASTLLGQLVGRAQDAGSVGARDWLVLQYARALITDPVGAYPRLLGAAA